MMRLLKTLGRVGQFAGLSIPFLGVGLELADVIRPAVLLMMLVMAVACFWLGRLVEGLSSR
jgi:hypothetical protein